MKSNIDFYIEKRILSILGVKRLSEIRDKDKKIAIALIISYFEKFGYNVEELKKSQYNEDIFNPLDGQIVRLADQYAAYIEASLSIDYGISTNHLKQAKANLYKKYKDLHIAGIFTKPYFDLFI